MRRKFAKDHVTYLNSARDHGKGVALALLFSKTYRFDMAYEFVEEPPEEYLCPVSMELLVSANQTSCCGSHLSENIATELERDNKPCPICTQPELKSIKDLYFRRKVGQVKVYCFNRSKGCKWEGEVSRLEKHCSQGSVEGDCGYVMVKCPYLCFGVVKRKRLVSHMNDDCPKRPFSCNYCNFEASYESIVNQHLPQCDKFPIQCPNKCDEILCRAKMKEHIALSCPLQAVQCEFNYVGCTDLVCRKDFHKHMEQKMPKHLDMLAEYSKKKDKEIDALKAQVQTLTNFLSRKTSPEVRGLVVSPKCSDIGFIQPPVMVLRNFKKLYDMNEYWRGPEFYSHIGGYKMSLVVNPNSRTDRSGYMGVYLQMLRGEYDEELKWPFYGTVKVQMLNRLSNEGHFEKVLLDASSYKSENFHISMVDRVVGNEATSVWGDKNFIAVKSLDYNEMTNTQYLKENTIFFQILLVSLEE